MAQALLSPLLDPETLQYTLGFLEDETSDRTVAGIRDFLAPMLDDLARMHAPHTSKPNADDNSDEVYVKLSALYPHIHDDHLLSKGCKQLDSSIRMLFNKSSDLSSALTPGLVVSDIRHGQSNRRPKRSVLPEKQKWNPNVKPDIVVTQLKARGATSNESKSKDIKLSNFDIQYAGRSILSQADLLLTAGRRYGLVGRNGIGKSTLLRAIAYGELRVPSHLKILHVEQEVLLSKID